MFQKIRCFLNNLFKRFSTSNGKDSVPSNRDEIMKKISSLEDVIYDLETVIIKQSYVISTLGAVQNEILDTISMFDQKTAGKGGTGSIIFTIPDVDDDLIN